MTGQERVRAAIAHRETGRVPYCIGFCPEGIENLREVIGDTDVETFVDNDVLRVSVPWWGWHALAPDWQGMAAPVSRHHVRGSGDYGAFFERLTRLRDETGKYLLVTIYGSHFEKANFARGIENFLADLAGEPEFARKLLGTIIEKNLVMLENFLTAPEIDGVLLGSDWGTQLDLIMSPDTWHEMIRPGEQKEYDLVHAHEKDLWIHSCGNVEKIIPSLIEMGVDVLNPVQPEAMDIAMLKRQFGDRLTFWGGLSTQKTLPYGTPDEVKTEARRVRELLGQGGGLIFSPSQEIQGDVPAENILALLDVAREPLVSCS